MAFSVNLAPGVRVSASRRGVRTSLGPRAARVHVGAGRTGFSTGVGPVTYSTTLGGSSSKSRASASGSFADTWREMKADRELLRSGEVNRLLEEVAAARAERRLKFEEARRVSDILGALMVIHHADFPPTARPIAPPLPAIDESQVLQRHMSAAKTSTSMFDRASRTAAVESARRAAAAEVAQVRQHYEGERQRWQAQADAWWDAILANEPTTVLSALGDAFADNEAAAAAVGIAGDEVTLVVVVPSSGAIPTEYPISVEPTAEFAVMAPMPAEDRAALYLALVAGHAVVTVKEAFAVAPAVNAARIIAVRPGTTGAAEVLLAVRFERSGLSNTDWNHDSGALWILHAAATEIMLNAGPHGEPTPLDLAQEPEIAAVIQAVDFVDAKPQRADGSVGQDCESPEHVGTSEHDVDVTEFDALHAAAQQAQQFLERGAGIAEQIGAGEWDADLTPEQARDLTDSLAETAEVVRTMRSSAGEVKANVDQASQWLGPLPLNRKERFFTGTVFPGLVAGTGFWHIQRLLDLFGVPAAPQVGEFAQIQFLTEYGFAESVFTDEDKEKWGSAFTRETPDIVILGPDWLLAIEAKMYHSPSAASLNEQMAAQAPIIDHWRTVLDLEADRVVHALLLPARLAQRERAGLTSHRVITWEALLDAFRYVGPRYWVSLLTQAIERHPDLESRALSQPNAEAIMTGAEIVDDAMSDAPTVGFVGRAGGSAGARFAADVESGGWRTQRYQVRSTAVEATNRNWMLVGEFLLAVGAIEGE